MRQVVIDTNCLVQMISLACLFLFEKAGSATILHFSITYERAISRTLIYLCANLQKKCHVLNTGSQSASAG